MTTNKPPRAKISDLMAQLTYERDAKQAYLAAIDSLESALAKAYIELEARRNLGECGHGHLQTLLIELRSIADAHAGDAMCARAERDEFAAQCAVSAEAIIALKRQRDEFESMIKDEELDSETDFLRAEGAEMKCRGLEDELKAAREEIEQWKLAADNNGAKALKYSREIEDTREEQSNVPTILRIAIEDLESKLQSAHAIIEKVEALLHRIAWYDVSYYNSGVAAIMSNIAKEALAKLKKWRNKKV